ncbi:hypothetical protein pb186bvf_008923 [Paramecium bursaria]
MNSINNMNLYKLFSILQIFYHNYQLLLYYTVYMSRQPEKQFKIKRNTVNITNKQNPPIPVYSVPRHNTQIQSSQKPQQTQHGISENYHSEIQNLKDKNNCLLEKYDNLQQQYNKLQDVSNQWERDYKTREKEVNIFLDKLRKQEDYVKKLRNKKKDYKNKILQLSNQIQQQNEQIQQLQSSNNDPFASLLEMRQLLVQMRIAQQILPLLQTQQRLRQYQNVFVDIDNMSYEQILELQNQIGTQNVGIPRIDIRRIPKRTIMISDRITEICTVCQCDLEVGQKYRKLGCRHMYHSKCIRDWLLQHKDCPVCKREVVIPPP